MKKLLLLLLLLLLLVTFIFSACGTDNGAIDPSMLENYNVIILKNFTKICGGTIIENNDDYALVLTAAHCVVNIESTYHIDYGNDREEDRNYIEVDIIKLNNAYTDLALLKTKLPLYKFPYKAKISHREAIYGEFVWAIGYGAGKEDALSYGIISKLYTKDHYGHLTNQLDITAWYGNSGGGVFTEQGRLIGVMIQFGPQGAATTGWMYAVPQVIIQYFLNNKVESDIIIIDFEDVENNYLMEI